MFREICFVYNLLRFTSCLFNGITTETDRLSSTEWLNWSVILLILTGGVILHCSSCFFLLTQREIDSCKSTTKKSWEIITNSIIQMEFVWRMLLFFFVVKMESLWNLFYVRMRGMVHNFINQFCCQRWHLTSDHLVVLCTCIVTLLLMWMCLSHFTL